MAVVGTNRLTDGGIIYKTNLIITHEKYNSNAFAYDVGLIHIPYEIEFTDRISSIALPTSDFDNDDYPGKVSGWGTLSYGGYLPDKLQALDLLIISQNKCVQYYASVLTNHHICTITDFGQGACNVRRHFIFIYIHFSHEGIIKKLFFSFFTG